MATFDTNIFIKRPLENSGENFGVYGLELVHINWRGFAYEDKFISRLGPIMKAPALLLISLAQLCFGQDITSISNKVLSRHRRFLIPANSGWRFAATLSLVIPIQDLGSSLTLSIPFSYSLDDGT